MTPEKMLGAALIGIAVANLVAAIVTFRKIRKMRK